MNICLNCKNEFIPPFGRKCYYCSDECRKEARRKARVKRQKEYNKAFVSLHKQYNTHTKSQKVKTKSLDETVREIETYNKEHGTRLSYGKWKVLQYFGKV